MIKVFLATSVHFWDDIRILRKEGISLSQRYEVELHAPAPFDHQEYKGIKIIGLPQWKNVSDRRPIRREIRRRIRSSDATVFHFHDPELILLALVVKLIYRKKVIYDIHEDYPAVIHHKKWIPRPLRPLTAFLFRLVELLVVRFFDHLITASPAIQQNFAALPATLISNYPVIVAGSKFPEKEHETIKFIYAGGMERIRGIRELLLGFIRMAEHSRSTVRLHIAGPFWGTEDYQSELQELFQHAAIEYHGLLPFEAARDLMRSCHVGVIPFLPTPTNLNIVPHKLFDYMEAGLAILASNFPGWPRDILEWNIGRLFDPNDLTSISETMAAATALPEELEAMGRRGFRLVREKFTWDSQESQIFKVYEQVVS